MPAPLLTPEPDESAAHDGAVVVEATAVLLSGRPRCCTAGDELEKRGLELKPLVARHLLLPATHFHQMDEAIPDAPTTETTALLADVELVAEAEPAEAPPAAGAAKLPNCWSRPEHALGTLIGALAVCAVVGGTVVLLADLLTKRAVSDIEPSSQEDGVATASLGDALIATGWLGFAAVRCIEGRAASRNRPDGELDAAQSVLFCCLTVATLAFVVVGAAILLAVGFDQLFTVQSDCCTIIGYIATPLTCDSPPWAAASCWRKCGGAKRTALDSWNPYMLPWVGHHADRPTVLQFLWIASETPVSMLHELMARLALACVSLIFLCVGWLMWALLAALFYVLFYGCILLMFMLASIGWLVVFLCSNYVPAVKWSSECDHATGTSTVSWPFLLMAAWPFLLLGLCLCGRAAKELAWPP